MKEKTTSPEPVKILCISAENFKALKAFYCEPKPEGLTVIGGDNGAGKTSAIDILAYGLGGAKYRPSNPKREGAVGDTMLHIELYLCNGDLISSSVAYSIDTSDDDLVRPSRMFLCSSCSSLKR